MRYELSDHEWTAIKPMLPNKPRGVLRVNNRRVLNGITAGGFSFRRQQAGSVGAWRSGRGEEKSRSLVSRGGNRRADR